MALYKWYITAILSPASTKEKFDIKQRCKKKSCDSLASKKQSWNEREEIKIILHFFINQALEFADCIKYGMTIVHL